LVRPGYDEDEDDLTIQKVAKRKSRYNEGEADLVVEQVLRLLNSKKGNGEWRYNLDDITIVTPYKAMREYIKAALKKELSKAKPEELEALKIYDIEEMTDVRTVDEFQGGENKIVIVPFVASNNNGDIGFCADLHRLVVALSRPQEKLIMIGDFGYEEKTGEFKGTLTTATYPVYSGDDPLAIRNRLKRKHEAEAAAEVYKQIFHATERINGRGLSRTSAAITKEHKTCLELVTSL